MAVPSSVAGIGQMMPIRSGHLSRRLKSEFLRWLECRTPPKSDCRPCHSTRCCHDSTPRQTCMRCPTALAPLSRWLSNCRSRWRPRHGLLLDDATQLPGAELELVGDLLEGAVIAKISGRGKDVHDREMFYEQPGATQEVSKNASQTQPARLLAMIFAKEGSTLTTRRGLAIAFGLETSL